MTSAGSTRPFTGTPSQVVVEQLAALGVRYVFNNTGSHEAAFFDALYGRAGIHGILGLHEGVVTSMAGGYAQAGPQPAVMLAHLDAGLGQSLGQMLNVWNAKLPVVTLTYAADTGSAVDKRGWGHHIHHSFGPTYLSAPYVKASWAVIDPAGLAHAVYRAVLTAMTPPLGPVHLAIYEDAIGMQPIEAAIIEGPLPELRAGYPSDAEVEGVMRALAEAQRPLLYVGDGIWKSGAAQRLNAFADRIGARVADGDQFNRAVQPNHPLHCQDLAALDPDFVLAIGVRQHSFSRAHAAYRKFPHARIVAVGPDVENLTNMAGLSAAVVADEARTLERLSAWLDAVRRVRRLWRALRPLPGPRSPRGASTPCRRRPRNGHGGMLRGRPRRRPPAPCARGCSRTRCTRRPRRSAAPTSPWRTLPCGRGTAAFSRPAARSTSRRRAVPRATAWAPRLASSWRRPTRR